MALPVTDVQGTKLYLVDTSVATGTPTELAAAIAGGKEIGCLQAIGAITMSKAVQQYNCINTNETTKSSGSVTLGNRVISTLFDSQDAAGQQELINMWDNDLRKKLIMVLDDNAGVSPTYITHEGFISNVDINTERDAAVMYDATFEMTSLPDMVLATAV